MFRSTTPSWSALRGVVLRQSAQQLNDHRLSSDLGTLALWHFGTLALWHFGTLALWHFGTLCTLALWHFGTLALWHFGTLALRHFGTLALWHFGNCRRVSTGQVLAGQRCSERACARSAGGESLALPVSTAIPKLPPYVLLTVT